MLTFALYVFAYVRRSHSLLGAVEFLLTGDVFLFVTGIGMAIRSNTLTGIGASVLAFFHLGWYINFVCPFIGEDYVFGYPNLAPLLISMHAQGAYVNYYVLLFLDTHYFWFMPLVLLILFGNGGLSARSSVYGVMIHLLLYCVDKLTLLVSTDFLVMPINLELRLVGGLVSIAILKGISIIVYTTAIKISGLADKKSK